MLTPHTAMLQLEVKMQVEYMSFSAHGCQGHHAALVGQAEPENVLLVHERGQEDGVSEAED